MNNSEKIKLLENKKNTFSSLINHNLTTCICFLGVATPICASTILTFNKNSISIFISFFYLLVVFLTLKKPIITIHQFSNTIKRIDKMIYSIITGIKIEDLYIKELYEKE